VLKENKNCLVIEYRTSTHLFVKVPRPEDSKVIFLVFKSSCDLLLPV